MCAQYYTSSAPSGYGAYPGAGSRPPGPSYPGHVIGQRTPPGMMQQPPPSSSTAVYTPAPRAPGRMSQSGKRDSRYKDDLLRKKIEVEQKMENVKRLSVAIGQGPQGAKRQQEVDSIKAKLQRIQMELEKSEKQKEEREIEEHKRKKEEKQMARMTAELESAMDPAVLTTHQKQRRTRNMMALLRKTGGELTPHALEELEAEEKTLDEKERKDRKDKMDQAERKLKEVNAKIKAHEKLREEQHVQKMQKQLELMESKLHNMESGRDSDDIDISRLDNFDMPDTRLTAEEARLRKEREEGDARRKAEMDKRLKELQHMIMDKKASRTKRQNDVKATQIARMEQQLRDMDKDEGSNTGLDMTLFEQVGPMSPAEQKMARMVEERLKVLEEQMTKRRQDEAEREAEIKKKEQLIDALDTKLKAFSDLGSIMDQIAKISKIESMIDSLNHKVATGGFVTGQGVVRDAAAIKAEIGELQAIIFGDSASEKEIADANIKLEKIMQEYEQTSEFREAKEKKRKEQEVLNKEALNKVRQAMRALTPDQFKQKLMDNPELRLLAMEPETILKLHQNDFKQFMIKNLSLDELRALRGCLPNFRGDQHVQRGWVESIESKIDEKAADALKPPPPPKPAKKPTKLLKIKKVVGAGSGDLFSELLAKKNKKMNHVEAGGGVADAPPPPKLAPLDKSKMPPLPPKGGPNGMPPLPPPGPPAAATLPPLDKSKMPPLPPKGPPAPMPPLPPPGPPASSMHHGPSASSFSSPPPIRPAVTPPTSPPVAKIAPIAKPAAAGPKMPDQAAINAQGQLKVLLYQLGRDIFQGASDIEVVQKCKQVLEQIKVLSPYFPDLASKSAPLLLATKEAVLKRSGGGDDLANAKKKFALVIEEVRRAAA